MPSRTSDPPSSTSAPAEQRKPAVAESVPPAPEQSTSSSLSEAVAVARSMNSLSARDAELGRLARVATQRQQFRVALDAARAMNSLSKRDETLDLISCYAAHLGQISIAREAVKSTNSL